MGYRMSDTEKLVWICILFPIPFLPLGIAALLCWCFRKIGEGAVKIYRKIWSRP
jgi:hypothetical protein